MNAARRWVGPGGCDAREMVGAAVASAMVAAPLGSFAAAVMHERWATSNGPELAAGGVGVVWAIVLALAVDAMRRTTDARPRPEAASLAAAAQSNTA
ncbi:MAG TPA: hypothetical protein VFX03_08670 [Thermomicrobiales bacterium]|nr:hypothetical protein [Thermomicrobiales bacterium]